MIKSDQTEERQTSHVSYFPTDFKAPESKFIQFYLSSDSIIPALINNTLAVVQDLLVLSCISDRSPSVQMGNNRNSLQICLFLSQKSSLTVAYPGKWLNKIWVEKNVFLIIFLYFKIIFE